uniref:NADH-ubiquinone oxidoreductase chain 6 n=1 Tax=Schistometopum thomense TaxID=420425 RepID=C9D8N5_SCHTH|nr:NADH dehydrogenase subunit 6 [Schistometopum thomense]
MTWVVLLGMMFLVVSMIGVASNPSPYFAAFGLVIGALAGCWVLVVFGMSFLSLVLFMIYLGGMLVVFAYSAALVAEPYPMAWGSRLVINYMMVYCVVLWVSLFYVDDCWDVMISDSSFFAVRYDWGGVSMLYCFGSWVLLLLGWVLLITLFIVLEVTRALGYGTFKLVEK